MSLVNQNVAHLQIYDAAKKDFVVPTELFPRPNDDSQTSLGETFSVSTKPFGF
jgi:hypothetical protein